MAHRTDNAVLLDTWMKYANGIMNTWIRKGEPMPVQDMKNLLDEMADVRGACMDAAGGNAAGRDRLQELYHGRYEKLLDEHFSG
jgi:hypothetical protein